MSTHSFVVMFVVLATGHTVIAQSNTIRFAHSVEGTILDRSGLGTGFTHRLPGTGAAYNKCDPNLDMASCPGILKITSTQAGLNVRANNLDGLEAPGVLLRYVRGKDIVVSALFTHVMVPNGSDHLMLYAGLAIDRCIKAGVHETETYMLVENNGGSDAIRFNEMANSFVPGDDLLLTLRRIGRKWLLEWHNLSSPIASGTSTRLEFPWLDASRDIYVGIIHANAGNQTQQTAQVHFFSTSVGATEIKGSKNSSGDGESVLPWYLKRRLDPR